MNEPASLRITPRLVLGVAVLLLGVAFTLENLDILDASVLIDFWPLILVAVGLAKLADVRRTGAWLSSFLWIAVGVWWTLHNLNVVDVHPIDLWPVLLIIAGFYLVSRGLRPGRAVKRSGQDRVGGFAVLSGVRRQISSKDFRGGDFTAVMGGCEVDLREARIAHPPAVIDVFAFWGGVDIRVPRRWKVEPAVTAILGGFDDNTDPSEADPEQRLVVRGLAMMGGVDLRH